ncbi:phage tail assembly chaperone [Pseudomonas sp. MN1F]|uniref:phage tail assembly chaperone n=1 Tax=Pseudomonas sp. MN1F TaxID=1366632 RepID=UPI00128F714D|nr:phage tail assembly chaperone [Pseudomonas sp. MN1F]MQG96229.1 phage tail protein [Pseudomonas sp. MN1F]
MKVYFAPDGGFYSLDFQGFVPAGSVEVTEVDYKALQAGQLQGKWIVANDQGYPVLQAPEESPGYLASVERSWRDMQLAATDGLVVRHRDELEAQAETTLTSAQYAELQAFRRALRDWPDSGDFPLIEHRPGGPAWLAEQT